MAQTAQINIRVDSKSAEGNVDALNKSIETTNKETQSLRTQLRQAKQELAGLEEGSEAFVQAAIKAGQLQDQMNDINALTKALAGSATENLGNALQGVATIGVAGFQGLTSAAVLFGNENENLQRQMVKLQAVSNLAQAISAFGGLKDTITQVRTGLIAFTTQVASSTVVTKLYNFVMEETTMAQVKETISSTAGSVAKGVQTAATWLLVAAKKALSASTFTAANAMRVLKGAIVATGIGALVVLLGEAISYMMSLGSETESAASKQEKLAAAAEKTRQAMQDAAALSRSINEMTTGGLVDMNNQLKIMIARGADYNAIHDQRIKISNEELRLLDEQAFKENLQLGRGVDYYNTLKGKQKERAIQLDTERKRILTDMDIISAERSAAAKQEQKDQEEAAKQARQEAKQLRDEQKRIAEQQERERQELRKKELDEFNARLEREKDAQKQLRSLYTSTAQVQVEIQQFGMAQIDQRTEREKELAKLQLEMDEFERDLLEKATAREIKAAEEKWIKSKKPIADFAKEREQIEKNAINNLTEAEAALLKQRESNSEATIEDLKKMWAQMKEISLASAKVIQYDEAISRTEFYKQQEIKEVEMSKKTGFQKLKAIKAINQDYLNTQLSQLKQQEENEIDFRTQQYNRDIAQAKKNGEDTTEITAKYESDIFNIQKETIEKTQKLQEDASFSREEMIKAQAAELASEVQMYGDMFMNLANAINDLVNQQAENQLNRINEVYDAEETKMKALYDSKVISEEEYNDKLAELQQQRAEQEIKIKRKQFEREKALSLINATIDTAAAVLQAIAQFGPPPSPAGIAGIALAGVIGAIQMATISQQQFQAATGGIVPYNGLPGDIDSVNSKLAPGEAVINARSTAMFPNVLSLINQAGGGQPLVPDMSQQGMLGGGTIFAENQPQTIKAYVVETEITDTQRRVNRIQSAAEF